MTTVKYFAVVGRNEASVKKSRMFDTYDQAKKWASNELKRGNCFWAIYKNFEEDPIQYCEQLKLFA